MFSTAAMPVRDLGVVRSTSPFALTFDSEKVEFDTEVYVHAGRSLPLPALHQLPEHKVRAIVHADALGLDALQEARLAYMAGLRFDKGKRRLKVTCEQFPLRIENRRWILFTIERLRRAAMEPDDEFDQAYAKEQDLKQRKVKWWWGRTMKQEENGEEEQVAQNAS